MQSAHDRDEYVTINWENIKVNKTHNFKKYDSFIVEHFNITYDFGSIMHYGPKAFSKDKRFKTIVPHVSFNVFFRSLQPNLDIYCIFRKQVGGDAVLVMGQREELSAKDILKLKAMYKCEMSTIKPTFMVNDESSGCSECSYNNIFIQFIFIILLTHYR